ncbi:MAG TPA: isoprenylcysteine carboxylmethyltransferase family protein [Candidatus Acidoferrales bacterium]|nr:isoprenylcysteine carboxylmethyltransferase family protein [Candidatus Acidoferrales bacterium]
MPQPDEVRDSDWRARVFKNRGLLLVPVALALVIFGAPSVRSTIVGLAVAALGEVIRIWAVGYSGITTRSNEVTAPQLVTAGPYAWIRNPLYAGNSIIALGFWLAFSGDVSMGTSLALFAFIAILMISVYATIIPLEESYLTRTFGGDYEIYRRTVPRIVPLAAPLPKEERQGTWRAAVIARAEIITLIYFLIMIGAVVFRLRAAR